MADVNSNININFNTAAALAQLRQLQAGLSRFHQSLAEGNLAAANAQKGLNAQLLQSIGATGKFSASQVKVAGSTLAFTSALEKNKLSLREYYRYTMAAATANTRVIGRAFAQEREIINRARRDRVKALQAQYIQMNKANSGFMDAIRIMPKSLQMASGRFTELGTRIQYAAQRQQFLNQLLKQGSTQLLNFGKNTQWAGRQLMVGLTMPLALLGGAAAKSFRELEKEIVRFRRVYGDAFTNDAETDAAVENITRLANEYVKYGQSVTKTMEMAATAAAAGYEGSALNAQVATATKLAILGEVEQQEALKTTISLQSAFGISSEELAKKIDFLNAVENQTLLSIEDLTIAIPKAAPVVKQLGGNVEDLAFFLTAMKEGGINASEGANALKSGLASLINPAEKSAKFLAELGININGIVESNAGDIKATVIGFANALDTLDPLNRARAIEQLFGKFQFSRLSTLFQNVVKDGSQASRALDLAGSSVEELAILSEREMKKIEDSVGVKFQAAVEQFKKDIMPLGKAFLEALTPVVQFFGSLFEKFNGLSDQTKKVIAIIVAAVAGLGPVVLMTFGLLMNGIANVIKLFALLRGGIARLNGQTNIMGAGFNYMTQEQIENAASSQQLHQTHTRLIEVFNVEKTSVNALAASYNSLSTQMRAMAAQNPALFAGGMGGAKRAVGKLPPVRKYQDGILSVPGPKGAGDVVPAMLAPGEAVIPTKTTNKYRGLISAMFQDKVPGFMSGRIPAGPARMSLQDLKIQRVQDGSKNKTQTYPGTHPERESGPTFVGMPKSFAEASQSRQILDRISKQVSLGRFGTMPPSDFGTKLQGFKGSSFPARGIGGVYRKPNGQVVVVKPTIDDKTALAEVRMLEIESARGMVVPKQSIRTMMDPTDPTGQRKFIVLESPYDPRFANMDGKFSKSDMIKQLVGSTLRGDKDLQQANVSGSRVPDVGNAGVFDRASGFRDFAKAMPSMEQQAMINLLGVKGGAKKFFAQKTSGIAASMSPSQYDAAIKREINENIPVVEKLIKSWDLNPTEKIVYGNMLNRLKAGAKTDWAALQPIHARAGEGIKKLEFGDFEKFKNVPESREQIKKLVEGLSNDAVLELEKLPEAQRERVIAAINKQKPKPAYMSQNKMIKFVEQNMVYKDGLFHDKKSLDAGSPTSGKTYEEVMKKVFYQMGLKEKDGAFVSDKKINVLSRLKDAMSPVNKAGGGWRTNVPRNSLLWKALDAEEQSFRAANMAAGKNDPLNSVREKLSSLGYSEKQIATALRSELSHIEKTGQSGRGPAKYSMGSAVFDLRLLNNYMNTKSRPQNILNWNNKNGNPLGLTSIQLKEFAKAANYMSTGAHPTTLDDIKLVQNSAQLDVLADDYLKQQKTKPKGFPKLGQVNASKGLLALLDDRIGTGYYDKSRPVFNLASGPDQSQKVLVDPNNEFKVDTNTGKITKLTNANTGAKPAGAVPSSGSQRDRKTTTLAPNQTVATRRQFAGFRGIRPFVMPGMVKGDTSLNNPTVKQGQLAVELRRRGLSQSEIDRTLRRFAQRDLKAKETQAKASEKAARIEAQRQKEQATIQKKQTQASRQRYLEEQRRAELNRQQALNYDAAVKEDQKKTLKAQKETQKANIKQQRMARQQRIGGVSGGMAMGLGMAGSALMMTGNMGAGMGLMGASAVAGLAPMFAAMGPFGLALTAVAAVGGGLFLLDRASKKAAEAQSKLVDATFATTEKMSAIGEITGKVGASEIYARKRSSSVSDRYTTGFERGRQQFGVTFLESEVGSNIMSTFVDSMKSGTDIAARQMAIQLSGYISDGVMSAEQAHSVASQIGINLNNQTITSQISGRLLELVGPSGEDLLINPLEIRVKLEQEQRSITNQATGLFEQAMNTKPDGPGPFVDITESSRRDLAAEVAAMNVQNLEFNQAQIDSLNVQYDKELKILEAKKAGTKDAEKRKQVDKQISALEDKRAVGVQTLRKSNKDILNNQLKALEIAQKIGLVEGAFFNALKTQVETKAESMGQGAFVENFLQKSKDLNNQQLEVKINTIVASGQMPTATATSLLDMFAGETTELDAFINATTNLQDPGRVTELINSLVLLENQENARDILIEIGSKDPEEADKLMSTITLMQKMSGKEINMTTFFKTDGMAKLEALQRELEAVEKIESPITRKVIGEIDTDGDGTYENMDALLAVWNQWENLDDETKKTVIQEYITLLRTITEDQVDAEIAKKIAEAGSTGNIKSAERIAEYYATDKGRDAARASKAANDVMQAVKQDQALKKAGNITDPDSTGKNNPLSFLDSLAMSIKQVRDNAFNALSPVESLLAAFRDKKTQQGAFSLFDGIQNRLLKLGAGEGLRGAIESMSAEDFSQVAALKGNRALFTFAKGKPRSKNTITGLTETGKAVDQGYKERDLGNFKLANDVTITGVKEQTKAYNMLISSGLSASQALDVVADKSQAAAIAAGTIKKGTPEWKKYIASIKESNTALERQAVLNKALRANEEFDMYKQMPELVSQMKALGYSTDQIDAVLGDPALAKELITDLKDGKLDADELATFLNNIEAKKLIDIQVQLNKGDLAGAAEIGRQIVDDLFAAQENLIRTGPQALEIKANDINIEDFEEKIEGITEKVSDLNRELEMNPLFGDRAIQTIQDENSRLSNDLTVISNAAEEVNKRYDEQAEALQKVSDINQNILDQQKQQIDLADAITSGDISAAARAVQEIRAGNASRFADAQSQALQQARENALSSLTARPGGRTREQIEEKQFENSQAIYAMETNPARVKILKDIQDKQDEIYKIEKDISPLVNRNRELQRIIDKQLLNVKVLGSTRDAWEKINAQLDLFAAAQLAADNPKALAGLLTAADTLKLKWDDILAKMSQYAKGVPGTVSSEKELLVVPKTVEVEKEEAKTIADEKFKEEARKKTQGFNAPIRNIERSLAGYYADGGIVPKYMAMGGMVKMPYAEPAPVQKMNMGGLVPKYMAFGGMALGTDTVPAMLTPGEFVMSRYAVQNYGVENMKSINSGSSVGDSVYNYNLNLNVKSDANPDDIARAVMVQIKSVDAQRIRGARF